MVNDILPADPAGNADHLRPYTMGILSSAEMGRCLGQMADQISDCTLLRSNAVLRKIAIFYNSLYINRKILSI